MIKEASWSFFRREQQIRKHDQGNYVSQYIAHRFFNAINLSEKWSSEFQPRKHAFSRPIYGWVQIDWGIEAKSKIKTWNDENKPKTKCRTRYHDHASVCFGIIQRNKACDVKLDKVSAFAQIVFTSRDRTMKNDALDHCSKGKTPLLYRKRRQSFPRCSFISVDKLYKHHDHRFMTFLIIFSET